MVDVLRRKSISSLATINIGQMWLLEDLRCLQVLIGVLNSGTYLENFKYIQTKLGESRPYKRMILNCVTYGVS